MASEDLNRMALERDLSLRQAKLSKADLQVIRQALNESRPLEALRIANEGIDRLDEELDAIEELEEAAEEDGDPVQEFQRSVRQLAEETDRRKELNENERDE